MKHRTRGKYRRYYLQDGGETKTKGCNSLGTCFPSYCISSFLAKETSQQFFISYVLEDGNLDLFVTFTHHRWMCVYVHFLSTQDVPTFSFLFFFCTIFHFVPVINVRGMKFYSSLPWPCWCYADIFVRIKHYVSLSQAVASRWEYFWEPFLQFSVLSFSPFLIVVISQSSFPSFNTALLSSGMEMRHFVAPCQRATDWTLAWMVQQMFADCLIYLFI